MAAIAIPRFTGVSENAQETADKATARTILSAVTMAEASLAQTGYPAEADTDPTSAEFLAKVNEALNDDVTYGTSGDWSINYAANTWVVYKDGVEVNP